MARVEVNGASRELLMRGESVYRRRPAVDIIVGVCGTACILGLFLVLGDIVGIAWICLQLS